MSIRRIHFPWIRGSGSMGTWLGMFVASQLGRAALASQPEAQLRGIWMHGTQIKTRAEADEWIARIAAAHLNAVFPLVWYWGGQAFYQSDLAPRAQGLEEGFDPLGYLVEQCHQRGIEVHAWFVNGEHGSAEAGPVFEAHPDWAVQSPRQRGWWYEFALPEVRQFQAELMLEVLRRYEVDGIHFDYIRYAGPIGSTSPRVLDLFADRFGYRFEKAQLDRLPVELPVSGNPLVGPTTAKVLAQFAGGPPAIALNRYGDGEVVLLNWHAHAPDSPAVDEIVRRVLVYFQAPDQGLAVFNPPENAERYEQTFRNRVESWLQHLGFPVTRLELEPWDQLSPLQTVVLPCVYFLSDEHVERLAAFVRGGGHLLVVDGPVFAIRNPLLQEMLGLAAAGEYFNQTQRLEAVGESPLIPTGATAADLQRAAQAQQDWTRFRRDSVTALVRDVYHRAKALKPEAQVTAAVFLNRQAADAVYQDWYGWLEQGIVDYVLPMCYASDEKVLRACLDEWQAADPHFERIIPGLSIMATEYQPGQPESVLRQIRLCLERGTRGVNLFSLHTLDEALARALASGPFADNRRAYRP